MVIGDTLDWYEQIISGGYFFDATVTLYRLHYRGPSTFNCLYTYEDNQAAVTDNHHILRP